MQDIDPPPPWAQAAIELQAQAEVQAGILPGRAAEPRSGHPDPPYLRQRPACLCTSGQGSLSRTAIGLTHPTDPRPQALRGSAPIR